MKTEVGLHHVVAAAQKHVDISQFRFARDVALDPQQRAFIAQANDREICAALDECIVSLHRRDEQGGLQHAATGFYMHQGDDYVVTAKHSLPTGGADQQLVVRFADGQESEGVKVLAADAKHDLAVLSVSRPSPMHTLRHNRVYLDETVYILGFPSSDQPNLQFTKGNISSSECGVFTITASAGKGGREGRVVYQE